jgi:hypothetical protein
MDVSCSRIRAVVASHGRCWKRDPTGLCLSEEGRQGWLWSESDGGNGASIPSLLRFCKCLTLQPVVIRIFPGVLSQQST